jgi:cytochrome P450/tellurite resistance protein
MGDSHEDVSLLPAPPARRWFPVIGETLLFLAKPFELIEERVAMHGPIFRTHLLGKSTVVLAGGETAGVFADEQLCVRDGSIPDHVRELFGGRSLGLLDGAEHATRKRQILAAFVPEALPGYVPAMQALVESALARWTEESSHGGEGQAIAGIAELKRLAIAVIAKNVISMGEGEDLETLLESFQVLTAGFTGLPIALPGTAYKRALAARDRIFEVLGRAVAKHRKERFDDGLDRMLAHRDEHGADMTDQNAVMELHHVFIAGYIVFAELSSLLVTFDRDPELRAAVAAEVSARAPSGALGIRQLASMEMLNRVVQETKRTTPVVPLAFGKARTTFALGGFRIDEGTMLCWAPFAHHLDGRVFAKPRTFDADRFAPERAEHGRHPFAFAPQGMGPSTGHKCPGVDYATLFMQVFAAVLLRDFVHALPEQDLSLDRGRIPPEPRDGLRVVFSRRAADAAHAGEAAKAGPNRSTARGVRASELPPLYAEDPLGLDALLALAEIVWADGHVAKEEADALVAIARSLGLVDDEVTQVERALRERPTAAQLLPLSVAPEEAEHLFTLACLVASADGKVDPRERAAIAGLGDRLRLDAGARDRAATAARAVGETLAGVSVLTAVARELAT